MTEKRVPKEGTDTKKKLNKIQKNRYILIFIYITVVRFPIIYNIPFVEKRPPSYGPHKHVCMSSSSSGMAAVLSAAAMCEFYKHVCVCLQQFKRAGVFVCACLCVVIVRCIVCPVQMFHACTCTNRKWQHHISMCLCVCVCVYILPYNLCVQYIWPTNTYRNRGPANTTRPRDTPTHTHAPYTHTHTHS